MERRLEGYFTYWWNWFSGPTGRVQLECPLVGESALHKKREMGIWSKSELISQKGSGPDSKIRASPCHWLCFDWIHPLLMLFSLIPPSSYSKSHFRQNVESVGSMKFASHLNNDDRIPYTLLRAALSLCAPLSLSAEPSLFRCSSCLLCVLRLSSPLCAPPPPYLTWETSDGSGPAPSLNLVLIFVL